MWTMMPLISASRRVAPHGELLGDLLVLFRVDVAKAQVFQLPLHLPDAQAVGQRREDIEGLLGDAAAFCLGEEAQRAHVVQPVRQLDQHHTYVAVHGQKCLTQGFRGQLTLAVAFRRLVLNPGDGFVIFTQGFLAVLAPGYPGQLGQLGDALDQVGNGVPEVPLQVLIFNLGVLDRVMQQAGGHHLHRHGVLRQDGGDGQTVVDVGVSGGTLLSRVGALSHAVGAPHQIPVRSGVIGGELLEKLVDVDR